ncbi:MAG: transporter substrate-binding domain-containing protein [Thiolinea sp.]
MQIKPWRWLAVVWACLLLTAGVQAADEPVVKVGVLKFGTVNWELNTIQEHDLDRKHGFKLELVELGGKNATSVALQGGAVDMIVSDWIWVSRQRAEQQPFTFFPYSKAEGSLMVPADGAQSLADMAGKKLGVAGGPVDKTWLILRAYSQKTQDKDLVDMLEPQFAAPPLLNELALQVSWMVW